MSIENASNRFIEIMAEEVINKLDGTHSDFLRIENPDKPSKIIILGTLGDISKDYSIGVGTERTSSVKNNSMSVKFLTNMSEGTLKIKPSSSLYYRVYPTWEEEKSYAEKTYESFNKKVGLAKIWRQYDCQFEPLFFDISRAHLEHPLDFKSFTHFIQNDENTYKTGKEIDLECLESSTTYEDTIKEFNTKKTPNFDWEGRILLDVESFIQEGEMLQLITVTLVNDTEESNRYETFFFNCNLEIELNSVDITPFRYEYEYEGNSYSYANTLRCLNCHANYDKENNKIVTKHSAESYQKKLIPKDKIDTLSFSFEDLSSEGSLNLLEELHNLMQGYITNYKGSQKYTGDERYRKSTDHFEKITKRFLEGVNTLKTNSNAAKAFRLLNKTFGCSSRFDRWRIFQIIFIVSLIPDIINKTERRDICEVLHVHTGGGKTESYIGCVIFSAFYDRLTGKKFGTTAITKFPLRMLSIQQLQRIAHLFIWAEEIRKEESLGGDPFSVAYFVGTTEEFPRHTRGLITRLEKLKREGKEESGKIVDTCPVCEGDVILDYKDVERYIIHRCKGCGREFRLFYTDEEIYRFLPTLIVSTVDKFAGIALNRRFKNIFGGKLDECPEGHGFIPHNDTCEVELDGSKQCKKKGKAVDMDFKTAPVLMIQDEMHLIRESFGTIDSHFETLTETLQTELAGYMLKNIAMTATITGAKEQIKHLYHKEINIFPGDSPEGRGNNDLFFEYDIYGGKKAIQRILIGLKPNLRDNQFASLLTLRYLSEFIKKVETDIRQFSSENGFDPDELENIVENYKIYLTYHGKKSDVYSMNYYLEAVANSKLENYKIKPKTLTGDNTLDDIKSLIDSVDGYFENPENKESLLSVFATNIVSHGIDIEKWNVMIFQGIPRSTAEYIQALSRVGRRHPGLVFVWFYPNRARDLSFYQNFMDYHEILEQKVENVPLSRWAKLGFKQTFTSIFNAGILNYISDIIGEPLYKVEKVNEIFYEDENKKKLVKFIKKAYITDSTMAGADYFDREIPKEIERRLSYLRTYTGGERNFFPNALKDCGEKYYKTQYGMRGIQDELVLKPYDDDLHVFEREFER